MSEPSDMSETRRPPRWPWACLVAAMVWVAVARVPLILNAEIHLDSDLAVDGLTLLDAMHGHWRWHFPGTPYMGSPPILLAMPAAWIMGVSASSLVIGGVLAYEAVVLTCFVLSWRAFGPRVAAWSLLPLAFASIGTVWLSSRLTGGHLLTVAWHAAALILLHGLMRWGGFVRALGLGLWCGLGLYLDQMFLMTCIIVVAIGLPAILGARGWGRKIGLLVACAAGFAIGELPRRVGMEADRHDAYEGQFATIFEPDTHGPFAGQLNREKVRTLLGEHVRLLGLECLPRLVTGHLVSSHSLPAEPRPASLSGGAPDRPPRPLPAWVAPATVALTTGLFLATMAGLLIAKRDHEPASSSAIRLAAIMGGVLVTGGFLVSMNIFNSDNYRYLVYWLVPYALGFGLLMDGLWRRGVGGKVVASALAIALPVAVTLDTVDQYRGFGWLDEDNRPVRRVLRDPALEWLRANPEVTSVFGGYWDVYRLQFLLGGRVEGLPYPVYPDRFDARGRFPAGRPTTLIARSTDKGPFYREFALREGGRVLYRSPQLLIIDWPLTP